MSDMCFEDWTDDDWNQHYINEDPRLTVKKQQKIEQGEAKYTPGPWSYESHYCGHSCEIDGFVVSSPRGQDIVYFDNDDNPATEANARLIAAAPELLKCARMIERWSHGLRHETDHESKMVKMARAAIAKAEGREASK